MSNDLKKERVKRILASIEQSAISLIDSGINHDPMDLVMDLTMTAYELDILTGFTTKYKGDNQPPTLYDNVIKFNPKDGL